MKTKFVLLSTSIALMSVSHAAIALTGSAVTGLSSLAPIGTLVLLVADASSSNFGGAANALSGDLTATSVPKLAIADASITTGETFGGDLVLGRAAVTTAGALPGGFTVDNVSTLQGKRFSLVYIPSLGSTSTNTNIAAATTYGIVSGSDWLLPTVNGGESFSFSSSDSGGATSFFRVTVASGVATNDTYASSSGANLTLVPEPSAALLGAVGALGLLRRRRN